MFLTLFLFFCSLNAFDGNCSKYEHFVELDVIEIANTDELGIIRIESDRYECAQKCFETETCLGLFQFWNTGSRQKSQKVKQIKPIRTKLNKNFVF